MQKLFILFIIYSFIGWSMETICKLIQKGRFINRGFLIGPWCPIYGIGCILLTLLLTRYKANPILLFVMAIIICSFLEYMTSYIMEKIFGARWWDYSTKKFNINGRICAETMIPFGLLGLLVIYFLNPFLIKEIDKIDFNILNIISIIILIIFILDLIISFVIIFNFKSTIKKTERDSTEEITKKVKEIFLSKSILHRRLVNAFPNFKNRTKIIKDKLKAKYKKYKQ